MNYIKTTTPHNLKIEADSSVIRFIAGVKHMLKSYRTESDGKLAGICMIWDEYSAISEFRNMSLDCQIELEDMFKHALKYDMRIKVFVNMAGNLAIELREDSDFIWETLTV